MECSFYVPTRIFMGEGCIQKNAALLAGLGRRAFIVTSPSSAKNGSLADMKRVLSSLGIACKVFDRVPQNPNLSAIGEMGREARAFGCDFVVGIGGGSAMDASKAAAVLAANDMEAEGVYRQPYPNKPFPVVAVPTTCGTGSEVTPVSVLTLGELKKSFSSGDIIPRIAFLDARYLDSLPRQITVETAVDALSHAVEGYLMADNWVSDMLAERVMEFFAQSAPSLLSGNFTHDSRERMLFMAMLAGLSINITRTSAVHAMGYALTTQRNLSHGRACGVLLGEYVAFSYPARKEKTVKMLSLLGLSTVEDFKNLLARLLGKNERYTPEELERYTELVYASAIARANPVKMEKSDVLLLYKRSLLSGE